MSTIDWSRAVFQKSRRSSSSGNCVLVARVGTTIGVRDSKLGARSPVLEFTLEEWMAFVEGVRDGELSLTAQR